MRPLDIRTAGATRFVSSQVLSFRYQIQSPLNLLCMTLPIILIVRFANIVQNMVVADSLKVRVCRKHNTAFCSAVAFFCTGFSLAHHGYSISFKIDRSLRTLCSSAASHASPCIPLGYFRFKPPNCTGLCITDKVYMLWFGFRCQQYCHFV